MDVVYHKRRVLDLCLQQPMPGDCHDQDTPAMVGCSHCYRDQVKRLGVRYLKGSPGCEHQNGKLKMDELIHGCSMVGGVVIGSVRYDFFFKQTIIKSYSKPASHVITQRKGHPPTWPQLLGV